VIFVRGESLSEGLSLHAALILLIALAVSSPRGALQSGFEADLVSHCPNNCRCAVSRRALTKAFDRRKLGSGNDAGFEPEER
jgi:hypothetical protein